mmetsp:Transcript_18221/g.56079  ORF Transcript_18221/g.56079 Transcript_18221/m.56079 type:complete len:286 (-) Transcript_18221:23-880(-)
MGCGQSKMGNDMAKMAGLAGPPTNKTGSSVVRKKAEAAAKTGVLSLTEHKLEKVPKVVVEVLGGPSSRLRTLDLSANKLEVLPDAFAGAFPKLAACKLGRNRLAALPALGSGGLKKLDASDNKIASGGAVACLAAAPALEDLDLSRNPLGPGGGPSFAALAKLKVLAVAGCGLTALLDGGGDSRWPALVELLADDNALSCVDNGLAARCPSLRKLTLERNRLEAAGVPSALLKLAPLAHLDLAGNPLSKKAFLDIPGCDEFMKRREKNRKKDGAAMADMSVCGLD